MVTGSNVKFFALTGIIRDGRSAGECTSGLGDFWMSCWADIGDARIPARTRTMKDPVKMLITIFIIVSHFGEKKVEPRQRGIVSAKRAVGAVGRKVDTWGRMWNADSAKRIAF